jgi:hypothetical protein
MVSHAEIIIAEMKRELAALGDLVVKVSNGKRPLLPMPELNQNAAFLAHVIENLEAKVKSLEIELAGARMDGVLK